ncbi:glycosyltransferase family 2 protein [Bacteroides fragilis]
MEVKNIKVSILVPIYGVEKYIERCVRSLLEQSFTDIEYIFVNDCTKDSSMVILNKLIKEYEEKKGIYQDNKP